VHASRDRPEMALLSCPSCGKAGIRLVAFTDAEGVLHISQAGRIL
jgi:hypothetical protein